MIFTDPYRLVDAYGERYGQLGIQDGIIEEIRLLDEPEEQSAEILMPAFVDLHVHFRDPGQTYKEDLESGMRAALAGGYTDVQLMANTIPVTSSMEQVKDIVQRADALGLIDVHPCISITNAFDGRDLSHLAEAGEPVRMISDDGKGVASAWVQLEAMKIAKEKNLVLTLHEEDATFSQTDMRLAENVMTLRDLYLAEVSGARVHFAHVSTKEAIEWIRKAKKTNPNITCEVTPHHLVLWDHEYRVNPPIRNQEDVTALQEALADGTIDCIATDHAPHSGEDKKKGAPGMTGLEIAFSLCYTHLIRETIISLQTLSRVMSETPARLLGLNQGRIEVGQEADLVVVDLEDRRAIQPDEFYSKGKNTPFAGETVYGKIVRTMCKGVWKYPFPV